MMTPKATAKSPHTKVRFPPESDLLTKLDKAADANGRSRNTEIIARLLLSFEDEKRARAKRGRG